MAPSDEDLGVAYVGYFGSSMMSLCFKQVVEPEPKTPIYRSLRNSPKKELINVSTILSSNAHQKPST